MLVQLFSTYIGQTLLVIAVVAVLGGFFRKILLPILLFLALQSVVFLLSPPLLSHYVDFLIWLRGRL
jgi:hypothetical protein